MNLLAFDTSTEYLSLSLQKGSTLFNYDANVGQSHSQIILPQIHALLSKADLQLCDLQGIAFGAGPGSFTGVRIAAGIAQGLSLGMQLPVMRICTLLALAEASHANKVIACIDARMGEIYHAAYEKVADMWHETLSPTVCRPADAPALTGDAWMGVGSGWLTYMEPLTTVYSSQLQAIQPQLLPTASAILKLAQPAFIEGQVPSGAEAMPIYVRNRVALKTAERAQGQRL